MFNDSFYPTPVEVVDMMLKPFVKEYSGRWQPILTIEKKSILEPEAGKGDIVDHLVQKYSVDKGKIYCIEIDDQLRQFTQSKGYKVIDRDFLSFDDLYYFDFIIMNPPWRTGVKHLLHAWEVIAEEGDIACVLNAESIRNAHTADRQRLAELISKYGSTQEIGQAFRDAERVTLAEASIVWLHKPKGESRIDFDPTNFEMDDVEADAEDFAPNELANRGRIAALVSQYEAAKRIMIEQNILSAKFVFYTQGLSKRVGEVAPSPLNEKINELKASFWKYVFNETNYGAFTTSKYQKKFQAMAAAHSSLAFSSENVDQMLRTFVANYDIIIEECITDVFEEATQHYWRENRIEAVGWKTNSSWRVAKKIIVPGGIRWEHSRWGDSWSNRDFYQDLDKAMCFLSGRNLAGIVNVYDSITGRSDALNGTMNGYAANGLRYDEWFHTTFFEVRFFKKGTVHLKFKDMDLWDKFNIVAAKGKNWIGSGK